MVNVKQQSKPDFVTLVFSNEAPDLCEEALPYLFDRFYRVSKSRTRVLDEHPSGLGLSVVKQLCICNHGNVTATLNGSRLVASLGCRLSISCRCLYLKKNTKRLRKYTPQRFCTRVFLKRTQTIYHINLSRLRNLVRRI